MNKIGITGSLASGKTIASKFLSVGRGPLFSADSVVKKLYANKKFKNIICKKFNIEKPSYLKETLRKKILEDNSNIKKLEKIIHPLVRKEMFKFIKKNKKKKFIFFEIPLLIESKLMKNFNTIIFVKANKDIRLKRFLSKGGSKKLFYILDKKQLIDTKKIEYCNHVVVNEKNIFFLKKALSDIIMKYE